MANSDRFVDQHNSILDVAREIAAMLSPAIIAEESPKIHLKLSNLAGKLSMHLSAEDAHLYPRMREKGDAKTILTVNKFATEMGGIADVFGKYVSKWNSANVIRDNAQTFITETKGLFTALVSRINKENTELYPLLDAL